MGSFKLQAFEESESSHLQLKQPIPNPHHRAEGLLGVAGTGMAGAAAALGAPAGRAGLGGRQARAPAAAPAAAASAAAAAVPPVPQVPARPAPGCLPRWTLSCTREGGAWVLGVGACWLRAGSALREGPGYEHMSKGIKGVLRGKPSRDSRVD